MKPFTTVQYTQLYAYFIVIRQHISLCNEITAGLDEWTRGWDGVWHVYQYGVGAGLRTVTAGTGCGWGKFLKNLRGWTGLGINYAGMGEDRDH